MGQGGSPGGNSYGDAGAGFHADGNNDTAGGSNVAKSLKTTAVGGNRSGNNNASMVDLVVVLKVQDQMVAVAVEDILEEMEDGLLVVVDLIWSLLVPQIIQNPLMEIKMLLVVQLNITDIFK